MRARPPIISFSQSWVRAALGHASAPHQKALTIAGLLFAVALLASIIGTWRLEHDLRVEERDAMRMRMAQLGAQRPAPQVAPLRRTPVAIARDNAAVGQLNIPWSDVFDGLERHAGPDIGLTTLEPDSTSGTLRVQAEARSIAGLLSYADQLSNDAAFSQLLLHQHETNEQDPNRPARLTFQVRLGRTLPGAKASS